MPDLALVVDAVLVFTALELLLLWVRRRCTCTGLVVADYALSLVSGLLLMAALRAALTPGVGWRPLACLAASGVCHGLHLRRRWLRAQGHSHSPP